MKGIFITLEGTDGAGKTTQLGLIKEYIISRGKEVITTREPGGTQISEKIRSIILDVDNSEMTGRTEALLYAAARSQHVFEKIIPALNEGKVVLCDRFTDSTIAYQCAARGLLPRELEEINAYAAGGLTPDITIYLDIAPKEGMLRKKNQKELDRMESMGLEFHNKVYEGYKGLCERFPERIRRIAAIGAPEEVFGRIKAVIDELL